MGNFILTTSQHVDWLHSVSPEAKITTVLQEIKGGGNTLLTFGTGIIVPIDIIERYTNAYNFHAASSEFPGRDAHHWAVYDGSKTFGAVAHYLTKWVDEGEIVATLNFGMNSGSSPQEFRQAAIKGIRGLLLSLLPNIWETRAVAPCGVNWSDVKRKRIDLINMCDMRNLLVLERERRQIAFQGFEEFFKL